MRVEEAFAVLRAVGDWLDSQGRRQRISNTTLETYRQWQSENANYIVTENESIIGLATIRLETLEDWPQFAQLGQVLMLRGLATHLDHRGTGVGAFAVRQSIKSCDQDADVYLDCVSDFLPEYYAQLGFVSIARQQRDYPGSDPYDITLMRFRREIG